MASKETVVRAVSEAASKLDVKELKEKQTEAVCAIISGIDTFVALPTGYGKSIIYGILPFAFDILRGTQGSIVVCISPLTAIMMDQQAKFSPIGLSTEFIAEIQDDATVIDRVLKGKVQLVYISPESIIRNFKFRNMLLSEEYKKNLVALAVDEAHCIKTWGRDFRTAFSEIGELRSIVSRKVPIVALTATVTHAIYDKVMECLLMKEVAVVALSPQRKNITYAVAQLKKVEELASDIAKDLKERRVEYPKTIIFCRNYQQCSKLYYFVCQLLGKEFTEPPNSPDLHVFRLIDMYTRASLPEMNEKVLSSFKCPGSKLRIVIATTAFGMGVDCPDIRQIIHYGPTNLVEEYVQETGRAGRDGLQSKAILLYAKSRYTGEEMQLYGENNIQCRRKLLFQNFLCYDKQYDNITQLCLCCDICAVLCECENCT